MQARDRKMHREILGELASIRKLSFGPAKRKARSIQKAHRGWKSQDILAFTAKTTR